MLERFVHLFDGAKGTFDLPFRPRGHPPSVLALGQVRTDLDTQITHDLVEHLTAGNRAIVHVQHGGDALKGTSSAAFGAMAAQRKRSAASTSSP
jgi:hypothetical protein